MLTGDCALHGHFGPAARSRSSPQPTQMANHFDSLKDLVAGMEDDFAKFYDKGNKAAGTRIRKSMQDLKKVAQDIRSDVQDSKNTPA